MKTFVAYSSKDKEAQRLLLAHLVLLERCGRISTWSDDKGVAGVEYRKLIYEELSDSDLFLPLISVDFFNSSFCMEELERAYKQFKSGNTTIIPIILRDCCWKMCPFLRGLVALPKGEKPIVRWKFRDAAFTDVVMGVERTIESLTRNPVSYTNVEITEVQYELSGSKVNVNHFDQSDFKGKKAVPQSSIKILYALSGNKCACPDCEFTLTRHSNDNSKFDMFGQVRHIVPRTSAGPRGDYVDNIADTNSPDNLILLCPQHHSMVDSDVEKYSVELLRNWKKNHESKYLTHNN